MSWGPRTKVIEGWCDVVVPLLNENNHVAAKTLKILNVFFRLLNTGALRLWIHRHDY